MDHFPNKTTKCSYSDRIHHWTFVDFCRHIVVIAHPMGTSHVSVTTAGLLVKSPCETPLFIGQSSIQTSWTTIEVMVKSLFFVTDKYHKCPCLMIKTLFFVEKNSPMFLDVTSQLSCSSITWRAAMSRKQGNKHIICKAQILSVFIVIGGEVAYIIYIYGNSLLVLGCFHFCGYGSNIRRQWTQKTGSGSW